MRSKKVIIIGIALVIFIGILVFVFIQPIPFMKKKEITVGAMIGITGPTSAIGPEYADGIKDATRWINDHGGINGRKINLILNDTKYDVGKARKLYSYYYSQNIQLIQGWGTPATEALRPKVNRDGVVYMSASYSAALTDPFFTPYNFFVCTDYSTSIRLAIKYIKKSCSHLSRPPRMIFIYPDNSYGRGPIHAGKRMAGVMGVEYGPDQIVSLKAKEAISQLKAVKEYSPDWVWLGGTLNSCAVIIRDAGRIGLDTNFIINTWGFDERLLAKAGDYANGRVYGIAPCAMWGDNVPGMKAIMKANKKYHPGKKYTISYVKGWLSMMVMAEGIRRAGDNISGPAVRDALETLKNFNLGNLSAPITYTNMDHRPNTGVKIYKIEHGKYIRVAEIEMPRDPRFLGW